MNRLHAALLALPLVLPVAFATGAYANDQGHKSDKSPAEWHANMCSDRYAHAKGKLAFLEAKLNITDKQQDAWNKFAAVESDGAVKERDACLTQKLPSDHPPSVLDQEANLETVLSAKLAQLQTSRPALEDFYKVLSSDQKEEFDRFGDDDMGPMHHHGGPGMKGPHGGPEGNKGDKPE